VSLGAEKQTHAQAANGKKKNTSTGCCVTLCFHSHLTFLSKVLIKRCLHTFDVSVLLPLGHKLDLNDPHRFVTHPRARDFMRRLPLVPPKHAQLFSLLHPAPDIGGAIGNNNNNNAPPPLSSSSSSRSRSRSRSSSFSSSSSHHHGVGGEQAALKRLLRAPPGALEVVRSLLVIDPKVAACLHLTCVLH
jgi:hypothetical protein